MKKVTFLLTAMLFVALVSNAQELKNKQGVPILPAAGDYAIGIDATPIFNFFGNFVKINSGAPFADPSSMNFVNGNNAIYAKYFVDPTTAYRATVRIGLTSTSDKEYVMQDGQSDPLVTVEDKAKYGNTNIILGAGMEKRRGAGRLQGFYGAEAQLMFAGTSEKYTYGNAFSSSNTTPTMTNFDPTNPNVLGASSRITKAKSGSTIGIGARAFVGVEYFFAPKVSVGGEFGWGLAIATQGDGKVTTESWDGANSSVKTTETKTGGGGYMGFDTDNFGGCIYMLFHF
ncbi:MAG TPA: hypothetical protein PKG63_07615 [Bacteroidales bacterium]|jgi:hypothetical protein|nr:hypothetical protein [Bacteroidales bacterium]HNV96324.1 hypothetical protein [Bacteroidales bacterium]